MGPGILVLEGLTVGEEADGLCPYRELGGGLELLERCL